MEPAFLENNRVIRRRHLGLGIIVATVAYVGAIKLTPSYAAEACMLLALMLTAVVLARVASAVTAMRRGGSVESETWASCRLNFKPGDMFLVAIVAVTFIGLSIWNQVRHDEIDRPRYFYGFPFHCIIVPGREHGQAVAVNLYWAVADLVVAAAITIGLLLEFHRLALGRRDADQAGD